MAALAACGAHPAALVVAHARSECQSNLASACSLQGQASSATWRLCKRPRGERRTRRPAGSGSTRPRSVLTEPPPEQKDKVREKGSSTSQGTNSSRPSPGQGGTWLDSLSNALTDLLSSGSASGVPIAKGNLSDLVARPLFYFLYDSFLKYGSVFKLEFGPKAFIIVSDPVVARHILKENSFAYDKGVLAEILEPIMGKGLIPADLETWKERRRAIVPAFHSAYLDAMVRMFSRCGEQSVAKLSGLVAQAQESGAGFARVEMESEFSSLALDIIGLAVFNFEFGSVTTKSPVIEAVYGTLAEAEHRSTFYFPYWKIPGASCIVPRQRRFQADLKLINQCLDDLISRALATREEDDLEALQQRDYSKVKDASVLRFLVDMRGEDCSSRQLRDDLMTMLIAGHETTAAVLTWATFMLAQDTELQQKAQAEVDSVLGGRQDMTWEDVKKMQLMRLIVSEALRMYPQPPLLIRRSLEPDTWPVGFSSAESGVSISKGTDIFIAVYNIHRSPQLWEEPDRFNPERFLKSKAGAPDKGWEGYDPARLQGGLYPNEVSSDFAFLPFGGGTRKCVGDQFAVMESVVGLALLLQEFDFRLSGAPEDVQLVTGATIHTKDGLWCNVSRRTGKERRK